jgi:2-methylcitrate dehydratase PrpD
MVSEVLSWLCDTDPLLDSTVQERARELFLDTLGCALAGMAKTEVVRLRDAFHAGSHCAQAATSGSLPVELGAADGAFLIGVAACWDEACEGLARAHGRPGLHAFATALALGLARSASLADVLRALVRGFEIGGRLGERLRIPVGMHVDGTWGTFASVTAAGSLLGASPARLMAAIEMAACQMPWSMYLPVAQGSSARNLYVGEACSRGIRLAEAAAAGVQAVHGALDLYDERVLESIGRGASVAPAGEWLITQGYLKPYAAVRHVHYGVAAALELRDSLGGDTTTIERIVLEVYPEAIKYCGNRAPSTPIQAQFSLSYGVACALFTGDLGPEAYTEDTMSNLEVRRLESAVELVASGSDDNRRARMVVHRRHGIDAASEAAMPTQLESVAERVLGDAEAPFAGSAVSDKFLRYVIPVCGEAWASKVASSVLHGELEQPLGALLES